MKKSFNCTVVPSDVIQVSAWRGNGLLIQSHAGKAAVGVYLTPKDAKKLAKALKRLAKEVEYV